MVTNPDSYPVVAGPMPPAMPDVDHSLPKPASERSRVGTSSSSDIEFVEAHQEEPATDSHALANARPDEEGAAQLEHYETEVKDLGWAEHPKDVPNPLAGGLPNEELWTLVRRFNKVSGLLCWLGLDLQSDSGSKCTMSKSSTKHPWEVLISTLPTKRNSPPTS